MAIDRIELMTLDTLPLAQTGEVQVQLNMLKQLAQHPDIFRLVFLGPLPADLRLHAKYALINKWQNEYDIQSINFTDFAEALIAAIYNGTHFSTLKHFIEPAVLILDDLHLAVSKESTQEMLFASVIKPRMEAKKLTVLFSEYSYNMLSVTLRDDLRNLLKLGFHEDDI